jgi:hypothetical protein
MKSVGLKRNKRGPIQCLPKRIHDLEYSKGAKDIERSPVEEERLVAQEQGSCNNGTGRGCIPYTNGNSFHLRNTGRNVNLVT